MKTILVFCSFYLISFLTYADTCPRPSKGTTFSGAYWFVNDNGNSINPVRCDYSNGSIFTSAKYRESNISRHFEWKKIGNDRNAWYQCYNTLHEVNYCPFG